MWELLLITIFLMGVGFFLFAIRIVFKKNGKFSNTSVGKNKEMAKRGIYCAGTQDKLDQKDHLHLLKKL